MKGTFDLHFVDDQEFIVNSFPDMMDGIEKALRECPVKTIPEHPSNPFEVSVERSHFYISNPQVENSYSVDLLLLGRFN